MAETLKAAIIGLGPNTAGKGGGHSFSYCHGWAYSATPGFQLAAACSRNPKNVADFVAEFPGCKGFQDYRAMLAEVRPDIVSVVAFVGDREEMVMAALENGARAVWIEKPFALSFKAARRMMAAAEKCGARLFVNHQRRYGRPFEWFKEAAGKIGDILSVDIVQPCPNLMDFGPHLIDAALYALGTDRKMRSIFAALDWSGKETNNWHNVRYENQLLSVVHFEDGTRITIEAGRDLPGKLPVLRLNGTLGFAELHLSPAGDAKSVFRARLANEAGVATEATNEHFHHSEDGALYMKRAAADIHKAITSGSKTRIEPEEAMRGLEILLGTYESARIGQLLKAPIDQPFS